MTSTPLVGSSLPRVEDERLLKGAATFIDDIELPGTLHCAFVRSPHAHARIRVPACQVPDDGMVFFASDLGLGCIPSIHEHDQVPHALRVHAALVQHEVHQPLLANGRAMFVGQPVAVVLGATRERAEDIAEEIAIDFDELPAVLDPVEAQHDAAPRLHDWVPRNRSVSLSVRAGDAERALADAHAVVEEILSFSRQSGAPIETRGISAELDRETGRLIVRSSTQVPYALRGAVAAALGLALDRVRVIAPEVGGGFGIKGVVSAEELVVAALALRLARPVKWTEDRYEHFLSAIHARDQRHHVAVGADQNGRIVGLRDDFTVNCGAYDPFGKSVPYNAAAHVVGPYRIPNVSVTGTSVLTNKTPGAPYRGSGRPEATFARERALDRLARRVGLTPVELRRRNLLGATDLPHDTGLLYRDGKPMVYDGVDCLRCLEAAVDACSEVRLPPPPPTIRRGVGVAAYGFSSGKGPWETAALELQHDGTFTIVTGATSQGQSHETVWTQIVGDELGIPAAACVVRQGDTDLLAEGWGTMASRSAVVAGNALLLAARAMRERLDSFAEALAPLGGGERERVAPTLAQVAAIAAAEGRAGELRVEAAFRPPTITWGGGVHIATVDVDSELGSVSLVDYVAAYDHGPLLNPQVAEGQMLGAIVQGIGGALLEEMVYDEIGQPLASFVDYLLPTAADVPPVRLVCVGETPTDRNPLGIRGLGEAGTVAPAAAIANAVEDALQDIGVVIDCVPITPQRVHDALRAAGGDARLGAMAPACSLPGHH